MSSRRLIEFIRRQPHLGLSFRKLRGNPRTIYRFCQEHPQGRFFCRRKSHAFAVIDGIAVGEPQGDRTMVLAAWELVKAPALDDVQRLHQLCPITMMDAACELDTSYRRVQGLALVLMRRGLARWRRGKLVSTAEGTHGV